MKRTWKLEEEVTLIDPNKTRVPDSNISSRLSEPPGSDDAGTVNGHCTVGMPPSVGDSDMTKIKQYLTETERPESRDTTEVELSCTDTECIQMDDLEPLLQVESLSLASSSASQMFPFPLEAETSSEEYDAQSRVIGAAFEFATEEPQIITIPPGSEHHVGQSK